MTHSAQLSEVNVSKKKPVSISLSRLVKELNKIGVNIKENDIVLKTNPALETSERVNEYREIARTLLDVDNKAKYNPDKPTIGTLSRVVIKRRLKR